MKTALVTGGAGFIGSYLCEYLIAQNWRCLALDDCSTGRRENLAALLNHPNFTFIDGAVENASVTNELVKNADTVFHLAAVVGVKKVMENTVGTINRNLRSTQVLLDACAQYQRRVLLASTSEVYGDNPQTTFSEDSVSVIGNSKHRRWCYAATKLLDEFYAYAHFHRGALPMTIARLFNTIGARQIPDYGMVMPNFIHAAKNNQPLIIHGDGQQSRCFVAVEEVVRALFELSENSHAVGETYNVGSNREITISELAQLIIKITNSKSPIAYRQYSEIYGENFVDLRRRCPDLTRLQNILGWTPQKSLTEILPTMI